MVSLPSHTFETGHHHYGLHEEKITREQWSRLNADAESRILREDIVILPGGDIATLRTVWHGIVISGITGVRLYGSAMLDSRSCRVQQIDVYDSRADANRRHHDHVRATVAGFHCARCRDELPHVE